MGTTKTCDKHRNPQRCKGTIQTVYFAILREAPGDTRVKPAFGDISVMGHLVAKSPPIDVCEQGLELIAHELDHAMKTKSNKRLKIGPPDGLVLPTRQTTLGVKTEPDNAS